MFVVNTTRRLPEGSGCRACSCWSSDRPPYSGRKTKFSLLWKVFFASDRHLFMSAWPGRNTSVSPFLSAANTGRNAFVSFKLRCLSSLWRGNKNVNEMMFRYSQQHGSGQKRVRPLWHATKASNMWLSNYCILYIYVNIVIHIYSVWPKYMDDTLHHVDLVRNWWDVAMYIHIYNYVHTYIYQD